jgi:hypothetical protein
MTERLDKLLANMNFAPSRGRLVFALDATASRQPTWDQAVGLTAMMFKEIAGIGSLSMSVGYFRGTYQHGGECKFSPWNDDPLALTAMMTKITCAGGMTQWRRILEHVRKESLKVQISAMILVGDNIEEEGGDTRDALIDLAMQSIVPVFVFQEGDDPHAGEIFREIAARTGGKHFEFKADCLPQLASVLGTIAKFSVGGDKALSAPERKMLGRPS